MNSTRPSSRYCALGYRDIHFLHGSFEFGKDFVAKAEVEGVATQFAFQTKAGDINLKVWNECRCQIDMLRTDATAHPSFDATLPRKAIFVTTGRLVGAAAAAAQQYRSYLADRGELDFTLWGQTGPRSTHHNRSSGFAGIGFAGRVPDSDGSD